MFSRTRILGILLLLCATAGIGYADQPRMQAARADLQQARAQLQAAMRNKSGHRAKAIGYINSAIAEINAGIRFDRRRNHASVSINEIFDSVATADQPHMERALEHLRQARSNLEAATSDKGGHRKNAIKLVNDAIDEVKKGIDAGE